MTLHEKLIDIQQKLKVPKLRENEFGNFYYRSVEDIEDKVKPFLLLHKLTLTFNDKMVAVGDRVYVEAEARLSDGENHISAYASAREAEKPKAKTDDAQLTGGCSSYARKYAAQGLFLIDDGKGDPDNKPSEKSISAGQGEIGRAKQRLFAAFKKAGINDSQDMLANIQQAIGKDLVETVSEAEKVIAYIETE